MCVSLWAYCFKTHVHHTICVLSNWSATCLRLFRCHIGFSTRNLAQCSLVFFDLLSCVLHVYKRVARARSSVVYLFLFYFSPFFRCYFFLSFSHLHSLSLALCASLGMISELSWATLTTTTTITYNKNCFVFILFIFVRHLCVCVCCVFVREKRINSGAHSVNHFETRFAACEEQSFLSCDRLRQFSVHVSSIVCIGAIRINLIPSKTITSAYFPHWGVSSCGPSRIPKLQITTNRFRVRTERQCINKTGHLIRKSEK